MSKNFVFCPPNQMQGNQRLEMTFYILIRFALFNRFHPPSKIQTLDTTLNWINYTMIKTWLKVWMGFCVTIRRFNWMYSCYIVKILDFQTRIKIRSIWSKSELKVGIFVSGLNICEKATQVCQEKWATSKILAKDFFLMFSAGLYYFSQIRQLLLWTK